MNPQLGVLLACLAVGPWVWLAATWPLAPVTAVVAVPSEGRELSSAVAATFSLAPYFVITDLRTSQVVALRNPHWRGQESMGLKGALLLLDRQVGSVLVKSIRPAAHNALYSRGVHVYDGNAASVLEAIQRFQHGMMADLGPPRFPHHVDASHVPLLSPCGGALPGAPPIIAGGRGIDVPALGLRVLSGPLGGATVVGVVPGSRASRAGLRPGDVVVRVGETVVQDAFDFRRLSAGITPETGSMLLVERGGSIGQLWITPGQVLAHAGPLPVR